MDKILTQKIGAFLEITDPSEEQIREGATLLLQCNPKRERAIYNAAMIRPRNALPWVRTDLKKYYGIRQRGLETANVERYNRETLKRVEQSLASRPATVPAASAARPATIPTLGTRGIRPDHDQLPPHIQEIWDKNADRWKTLGRLHTQLAQMIAKPGYVACDGNELCYQMRQIDDALRQDYDRYDNFKLPPAAVPEASASGNPATSPDNVDVFTDNVRTIQNARTALSRGLARKTPHTPESLRRLQEATDTLIALKQTFKPETMEKLKAVGISIQQTDNYAKG